MRNFKIGIGVSLTSLLALAFAAAATGAGCSTGSSSGNTAGTTGAAGSTATAGTTGTGTAGATGTATAGTTGTSTAGTTGTATAGTTGGGGDLGAGGAILLPVTTGVCAGAATRTLVVGAVDDFEMDALSPGWSTFNDIMGAPNSIKMTQDPGGALGTAHFGHYAGMGATTPVKGGYGVGAIYNVAIDMMAGTFCIDVTGFDGLTFWAKAAKDMTKVGVNFVVPETNAVADGGDCKANCYVHPQKTVTLTTEWKQYSIPFSAAVGGTAKIQGRIQELGWLSPDADWDFSIDEIQFYKGTPPTTPVASSP